MLHEWILDSLGSNIASEIVCLEMFGSKVDLVLVTEIGVRQFRLQHCQRNRFARNTRIRSDRTGRRYFRGNRVLEECRVCEGWSRGPKSRCLPQIGQRALYNLPVVQIENS